MPRVTFTANLRRLVDCPPADVPGSTVGEALEGHGTVAEVREEFVGDLSVVVDEVAFGVPLARPKDSVGI